MGRKRGIFSLECQIWFYTPLWPSGRACWIHLIYLKTSKKIRFANLQEVPKFAPTHYRLGPVHSDFK